MTLSTYIYLQDQVDYREVFVKCNQLIGADEGVRFSEHDGWIGNRMDQGLCALMHVSYGAPLVSQEQAAAHDEDCAEYEGDCRKWHPRACWAEVNFDTAYSYSGPDGGCGDLHARLVAELGQWLDERGVHWAWRNEFTGEVHQGYDGLTELGTGGAEASAWFRNIAAPAIAAHIASGQ